VIHDIIAALPEASMSLPVAIGHVLVASAIEQTLRDPCVILVLGTALGLLVYAMGTQGRGRP
jgi:hypothetical protein